MRFLGGVLWWGLVIYAVMYLLWSATVIYQVSLGYVPLALRLIVLFLLTAHAARSLRLANWKDILPFAIGWALVAMLLDVVFLVPFLGWELYGSLSVWAGYLLIVLFPLGRTLLPRRSISAAPRA